MAIYTLEKKTNPFKAGIEFSEHETLRDAEAAAMDYLTCENRKGDHCAIWWGSLDHDKAFTIETVHRYGPDITFTAVPQKDF